MPWFHAYPEYAALWPTLEQLEMDEIEELRRQLDIAHQQIDRLQQDVDYLTQQRQCNEELRLDRRSGFNTSNLGE